MSDPQPSIIERGGVRTERVTVPTPAGHKPRYIVAANGYEIHGLTEGQLRELIDQAAWQLRAYWLMGRSQPKPPQPAPQPSKQGEEK